MSFLDIFKSNVCLDNEQLERKDAIDEALDRYKELIQNHSVIETFKVMMSEDKFKNLPIGDGILAVLNTMEAMILRIEELEKRK